MKRNKPEDPAFVLETAVEDAVIYGEKNPAQIQEELISDVAELYRRTDELVALVEKLEKRPPQRRKQQKPSVDYVVSMTVGMALIPSISYMIYQFNADAGVLIALTWLIGGLVYILVTRD